MPCAQYDLWIPVARELGIAPRSAIVSSADQDGERRLCYYEGNLFSADNLVRYADRVRCAVSRAVERYPTVARASLPREALNRVGRFDARARRITALSDPDALRAYLDPEPCPEVLTADEARRRIEQALRGLGRPASGPAWHRLHAWTGRVRAHAGGMLIECATEQGDAVEWLSGLHGIPSYLAPGLRDLLDRENAA